MGSRAIENRIKKLKEIEVQQKALEEQAEKRSRQEREGRETEGYRQRRQLLADWLNGYRGYGLDSRKENWLIV